MRNRNIFSGESFPPPLQKEGWVSSSAPTRQYPRFRVSNTPAPNLSNMEHQGIFCETSETSLVWRLRQHCYTSNEQNFRQYLVVVLGVHPQYARTQVAKPLEGIMRCFFCQIV